MATYTWNPADGGEIEFIGEIEFRDIYLPAPGKDEWGVDTLIRTVKGPAHLLETYVDALAQGATYSQSGDTYYLQTWSPIDHHVFPGVTLYYKGIKGTTLPADYETDEIVELVSSVSAVGLSISYGGKTIISGVKETKYLAPQTTYRYLSATRPTAPTNTTTAGSVQIIDQHIIATFSDGTDQFFGATAPAGLSTALAQSASDFAMLVSAVPIIGTGLWECVDVVRKQY